MTMQWVRTEDHTKRHEALDNLDYQENAEPIHTDVMSPPQELFHEGRPETVAAASTTAIYQAQYATVTTSKFHFSVGTKTPAMSTIELYAKRQAEMMSMSDKETPQKSNVSPPAPRVVPSIRAPKGVRAIP